MRFFKVLIKKCFVDLVRNIKQYIAIVFIIGIAVTLYSGLDSNAVNFANRVADVYSSEKGNLSDIWLTLSRKDIDADTSNQDKLDLQKMEEIAGDDGAVETRLMLPSSIESYSAYGLISFSRPTINKDYDTIYDTNSDIDDDFFFVDKNLIEKYEDLTGKKFTLGDTLPVSFEPSLLKSYIDIIADNYDIFYSVIYDYIDEYVTMNEEEKANLLQYLSENKDNFSVIYDDLINRAFSSKTLVINSTVNGIMSHPENIENGSFNASYYLMGTKTILINLIEKMGDIMTYDYISDMIEDLYDFDVPPELEDSYQEFLDKLKGEFSSYENDRDLMVPLVVETINYNVRTSKFQTLDNIQKSIYNQYIIKLGEGVELDEAISEIKEYYSGKEDEILALTNRDNMPSNVVVQSDIKQAKQLTYVFPVIFFVVAILVVLTTISQIILKERTQIGTFKALGIPKRKIFFYYSSYINIIALIGTILGFICGPLILPNVMNIKYSILYELPEIGYVFPWLSSVVILLLVIFLVSIMTLALIFKELSYVPAESMRPSTPNIKYKKEKHNPIKNVSIMMALRNMRVHITKSVMVVLGVMGCTGLLICGMGIDDTINSGKDIDTYAVLDADYLLAYNAGTKEGTVSSELEKLDIVGEIDEFAQVQTDIYFDDLTISTTIFYFDKDAPFFKYDDDFSSGHWDIDSVAMSEARANDLGVKEDDEITFVYSGKKYENYKVSKIFYTFTTGGLFIYTDTITDLTNQRTNAWLNLSSKGASLSQDEVKDQISEASPSVNTIMSRDDTSERIDSYMGMVKSMTNTIKVFAILLAVIVLINLAMLNFMERLREIATLKVLGFSRMEIGSSLIYEVMILTIIGATLGLFIGKPFEILVMSINVTPLVAWHYYITPLSYVLAFALSILTALIVNFLMTFKINKVQMAESLKSIE